MRSRRLKPAGTTPASSSAYDGGSGTGTTVRPSKTTSVTAAGSVDPAAMKSSSSLPGNDGGAWSSSTSNLLLQALAPCVLVSAMAAYAFGRLEWKGRNTVFTLYLLTMTVARCVHHYANVPFDMDTLAATETFQTALSIVWGTAAFAAMTLGTRHERRPVWLGGAALMSVVVLKLFLVDLANTGTVERVVSFLGVGIMLLVVGYFAPVPPRHSSSRGQATVGNA